MIMRFSACIAPKRRRLTCMRVWTRAGYNYVHDYYYNYSASIERDLLQGITVICDRYAFSGVAFSAAKGLPLDWCRSPDISLPAPDLTLFLDISPEKAKERGGYGSERYEMEEMQRRVRSIFQELASDVRQNEGWPWVTIDASRTLDAVREDIWTHVAPLLGNKNSTIAPETGIRRLWDSHTAPSSS